jgi:hypothetical protein
MSAGSIGTTYFQMLETTFQQFTSEVEPYEDFASVERAQSILKDKAGSFEDMERAVSCLNSEHTIESAAQRVWKHLLDGLTDISNVQKVTDVAKRYLRFHHFMHALFIHTETPLTVGSSQHPWSESHLLFPLRTHCDYLYRNQEEVGKEEESVAASLSSDPLIALEKAFHSLSVCLNPFEEFASLEKAKKIHNKYKAKITALNRSIHALPSEFSFIQCAWREVYGPLSQPNSKEEEMRSAGKNYLLLHPLLKAAFAHAGTPLSRSLDASAADLIEGDPLYVLRTHFADAFPTELHESEEESASDQEEMERLRREGGEVSAGGAAAAASASHTRFIGGWDPEQLKLAMERSLGRPETDRRCVVGASAAADKPVEQMTEEEQLEMALRLSREESPVHWRTSSPPSEAYPGGRPRSGKRPCSED